MAADKNYNPKIMKTLVLCMLVLTITYISKAQNVNIPDANFKNALIKVGVDTDENGEISRTEAEAIISLNVRYKNIADMTGIEAFINLDTLNCNSNRLTSLDISNNTTLLLLRCHENQLTNLDVSNNTALTWLNCSFNQLSSLNVSNNTALLYLNCSTNQLTNLDVSNNTTIFSLTCDFNQLTSLDVSNNTTLKYLRCGYNQLTNLDVSNNTTLINLWCGYNQLTNLDISNNTALEELNIIHMPTLYEVCIRKAKPPGNPYYLSLGSPNVYFTTDCAKNIQR